MTVSIHKHFDYLTPFEEAENDHELEEITRLKYPKACSKLEVDASFFADMVEGVRKHEAWRVIGLSSFEEFCESKLGKTLKEVQSILTGVKTLRSQGVVKMTRTEAVQATVGNTRKALPGKGGRPEPSDSLGYVPFGSTSKQRLAARLKRDHPDIIQRIQTGEFKSIYAAAKAAGIVKIKTPLQQLNHWWEKASVQERAEFMVTHGDD